MKKGFLSVIVFMSCCVILSSCIKTTYVNSTNPSMIATIPTGSGNYTFIASTVVPSVVDTQNNDTSISLIITGNSSDIVYPWDKIVLTVYDYKGRTGTFSIVDNKASAYYLHSGMLNQASGGIVSITQITANSIIGYFNFNDDISGVVVNAGTFNVGKPGY
jgi:hypothetical protein